MSNGNGSGRGEVHHLCPVVFNGRIWQEDGLFVSHCTELDVATSAETEAGALRRTRELIEIHLEEALEDGTLGDILRRVGPAVEPVTEIPPYMLNLLFQPGREVPGGSRRG